MLEQYNKFAEERLKQGIPPLPLTEEQTVALTELLKSDAPENPEVLLELFTQRVPPGVDPASKIKADFLYDIAIGKCTSAVISKSDAVKYLGTMLGGYNVTYLVELLKSDDLGAEAAKALCKTLMVYDAFDEITGLSANNKNAAAVIESWANAEWFTSRPEIAEKITLTVFKVDGEINTDDLSPASEAWSRPDIPLHANSMLQKRIDTPLQTIKDLKDKGYPLVFVGDVMGTGSSRKSATNSVLWHIGNDIPFVPNKRDGGVCLGGKIAPIFFNTLEDAGSMPIECDVSALNSGDVISILPFAGKIVNEETGAEITSFAFKTDVLLDEIRAGGRIPLIIGRNLTEKAREFLGLDEGGFFRKTTTVTNSGHGYTLAQKIVGRACAVDGVLPGSYCEPKMTTVGSQDTTGPMTRDEMKELACLKFSADLVMQSFCHTAAYPKPVDVTMHNSLPQFIQERGGVPLKPGDGVIHSWLNRMVLPDTVGTGGDSHTRFPIGLSFPAGSGLVAFAAAFGKMPLDMPESVLVRFTGKMNEGITLRDLVNAIPYVAIQKGLLTVEKKNKKNVFSGRILEIEGLENLSVDEAFELTDASAERSAAGCTIKLNKEPVITHIKSSIGMLKTMLTDGYGDSATINSRIADMEAWLQQPELLEADSDAKYAEVIEIDMGSISEPILCCPNDPDDVRLLSDVSNTQIDEVFIGSCMTNIGHYRAAAEILRGQTNVPTRLWVSPATRLDEAKLREEGYYAVYGQAGARMEIPGCSLCMGNQARIAPESTAISTSTRNFPNRVGDGANVYLGSAELAAVCAILGKIPDKETYSGYMQKFAANCNSEEIYSYLQLGE